MYGWRSSKIRNMLSEASNKKWAEKISLFSMRAHTTHKKLTERYRQEWIWWLNFWRFFHARLLPARKRASKDVNFVSPFPPHKYRTYIWAGRWRQPSERERERYDDCDDDRDPWGLRLIEFYSPHRVISNPILTHILILWAVWDDDDTMRPWLGIFLPYMLEIFQYSIEWEWVEFVARDVFSAK